MASLLRDAESSTGLRDGSEIRLQCRQCEAPDCSHETTCRDAVACYKSRSRDSVGIERLSRGCINSKDSGYLLCTTNHRKPSAKNAQHHVNVTDYKHEAMIRNECCTEGDFCNDGPFPAFPRIPEKLPMELEPPPGLSNAEAAYIIVSLIAAMIGIIFGIGWVVRHYRKSHKKRIAELMKAHEENLENCYPMNEDNLQVKAAGDSTLKEYLDGSMTSGSGSGLPLLIQRTLAKNIQLVERIGKGRYGEVWKALWNCEHIAVKIFSTLDEASWIRETEIYSSVMLRHNSILGFYGSDMTSRNSTTQLWLVTHYHRNGSLYDFLNKKPLTEHQLLKLAYSMANGLAFLHSEMVGTENRAGIAHRDIKSKNILVSNNETCIIADFGLAVTHKRDTGELNVFPNPKVGTRRYMAPEVLDESISPNSFDAFKRVDMYAAGLVIWEMARRTISQGIAEEYQPPFYDTVPPDPSFEEMRKVVCCDGYRPEIPNRWSTDPILTSMSKIIKECWHHNSSVRLSALRVKKSIAVIAHDTCKGLLNEVIP